MATLQSIILYCSLFISLFFEVFLLITYFEAREEIKAEKEYYKREPAEYPSVTIIVPCYNEEKTVGATIESLLALNYPKDKFELILVDDGSKDNTLALLRSYESNPQIRVFTKENGGKASALNFVLENHVKTELVGCLDADSFVDSDALRHMVPHFANPEIKAVTPSIKVYEPKTVLQHVQKVEYSWGIFLRRMLSSVGALYVTPGPFSIFRLDVFKELGGYRHAHQTEDMELALRMQKNHYKFVSALNAVVYTVTPAKLKTLYKQRRRWTYGFLNNAIDYRDMYFNKQYGNIGVFVLPIATVSIFFTLFAAATFVWHGLVSLWKSFAVHQAIGWSIQTPHFSFDWFYVNTGLISVISSITIMLTVSLLMVALTMANGKLKLGKDVVYYLTIYMFIVPLWLASAAYNTIFSKSVSWR